MSNSKCSSCVNCASFCKSLLKFFGRIAIAAIFLLAGLGKFLSPESNSLYMAAKGIPVAMIPISLYSAAIVEILCGIMLVIGFKTRWAALVLFLFLVPATLIFHNFWNVAPAEADMERIHFLKNLAIMGGLLYVVATGAGGWCLDRYCHRKEVPPQAER